MLRFRRLGSLAVALAFSVSSAAAQRLSYQAAGVPLTCTLFAPRYHLDLGSGLRASGSLDTKISDLDAIREIRINIVSQIDSVFVGRGGPARPDPLKIISESAEGAHRDSGRGFLVMPEQEVYGSPLGGHTDLLFSHPVYWNERTEGHALVTDDPKHGRVCNANGAADFIEMAKREDILISVPHPSTKGSAGYPDAIKDKDYFKDPHYQGIGFGRGMGLDLSGERLCDHGCLTLPDDMSNWLVNEHGPPKYLLAITETRFKAPGEEVYAASPVNYVKLASVASYKDVSPVVKTLMRGDYSVTSGEVLIDSAEVVSAMDLPAFGRHHFEIPFPAAGQKWVRFFAWDSAGNGAMGQPVKLGVTI